METVETSGNGKWCSVTETLSILGISRKTLYQRLKDEKLISKKTGKNRFFWIDDVTEIFTETQRETKETLPKQVKRHDTIVMQLSQQNQLLLDKPRPFWKFW